MRTAVQKDLNPRIKIINTPHCSPKERASLGVGVASGSLHRTLAVEVSFKKGSGADPCR